MTPGLEGRPEEHQGQAEETMPLVWPGLGRQRSGPPYSSRCPCDPTVEQAVHNRWMQLVSVQ